MLCATRAVDEPEVGGDAVVASTVLERLMNLDMDGEKRCFLASLMSCELS